MKSQICLGLNANEIQILYHKHHNVSLLVKSHQNPHNRPFSKMAAEISDKSKLKTYTSTTESTFTLVTLQSFRISGVILAEKMSVENWKF